MASRCTHRARVVASLAAALVVACEAAPPFDVKYESDRLRIGTSFEDLLCQQEITTYEAHIDAIEEAFGVSREFAWLYLYRTDERGSIAEDCKFTEYGDELLGCFIESVARSTLGSVAHELTHAWMATLEGGSLPWLREGVAVAFGGPVQRSNGPIIVEDLLSARVTGLSYRRTGHFAAWLLARYGVERFKALYTGTSDDMTSSRLAATFMDVLGAEPEDVLLDYETTAKEYYPGMGAYACGRGARIEWIDDAATWETGGSCAEGSVRGLESTVQMQRVIIDVPLSGAHVLDVDGRVASLTYCLTAPANAEELPDLSYPVAADWEVQEPLGATGGPFVSRDWADPVLLEAGTYEIWIDRTVDENGLEARGTMSLRRL